MKTTERIQILSRIFRDATRYGFTTSSDLEDFLRFELGSEKALDEWIPSPHGECRAIAPKKIYIICAGNLSVSSEVTLLLGLLLGSELFFKLPSNGLPEFEALVSKLPPELKYLVHLLPAHDEILMKSCDAVIVFGSDETVAEVHRAIQWNQRFLGYGHKISLGIIDIDQNGIATILPKAIEEICAYEQSGCLSPQAYLCTTAGLAKEFASSLAKAFEAHDRQYPSPPLSWEESALIFAARQNAHARGDCVYESSNSTNWTVTLRKDGKFEVGPSHRFIQITVLDKKYLIENWKDHISSISVTREHITEWEQLAHDTGASRLCSIGDLQRPPLAWRHDGRPRVGDLVHWIYQAGS